MGVMYFDDIEEDREILVVGQGNMFAIVDCAMRGSEMGEEGERGILGGSVDWQEHKVKGMSWRDHPVKGKSWQDQARTTGTRWLATTSPSPGNPFSLRPKIGRAWTTK